MGFAQRPYFSVAHEKVLVPYRKIEAVCLTLVAAFRKCSADCQRYGDAPRCTTLAQEDLRERRAPLMLKQPTGGPDVGEKTTADRRKLFVSSRMFGPCEPAQTL